MTVDLTDIVMPTSQNACARKSVVVLVMVLKYRWFGVYQPVFTSSTTDQYWTIWFSFVDIILLFGLGIHSDILVLHWLGRLSKAVSDKELNPWFCLSMLI